MRLDLLLVRKGLAESREKAKRLIMAGLVNVNQVPVDKPGNLISASSEITLKKPPSPYVSRGGLKLEAALNHFSPEIIGKVLMDVGSSTGGFTDCLLQRGARRIIAVDVGYGQLHWRLREDPRVRVFERTNIRYMQSQDLNEEVHGAVIDVSFISLKLVVPPVSDLLLKNAFIMALIKPQFEVGKGLVGKGGVVRDPLLHEKVIHDLATFFQGVGWITSTAFPSPILGPKGNREFFMLLRR